MLTTISADDEDEVVDLVPALGELSRPVWVDPGLWLIGFAHLDLINAKDSSLHYLDLTY